MECLLPESEKAKMKREWIHKGDIKTTHYSVEACGVDWKVLLGLLDRELDGKRLLLNKVMRPSLVGTFRRVRNRIEEQLTKDGLFKAPRKHSRAQRKASWKGHKTRRDRGKG